MKYIEQYIEERLKIKALGKLTTRESGSGEEVGTSLVIDGCEPGIEVRYIDYAKWLEEKLDGLLEKEVLEEEEQIMFPFEKFRSEVLTAMANKPKDLRDGQFVFNYIDKKYGVAGFVKLLEGVDCFHNDDKIEEFIKMSYDLMVKKK